MNYHMAKKLVFNKVRSSLGLDHCHSFLSGAAPLSEATLEFFLNLDVPISESYGLSESSGPHTISSWRDYKVLRYRLHRPGFPGARGRGLVLATRLVGAEASSRRLFLSYGSHLHL